MKKLISKDKNIIKEQVVEDPFVKLVNGGRTMGGVPLLPEIPPVNYKKVELFPKKAEPVIFPFFNERDSYQAFLAEKKRLRVRFDKFLKNYAHKPLDVCRQLAITDFDFRKETQEDKIDFGLVLEGKGVWEKIKLPHYVGPEGRWNAYYRTSIILDRKEKNKTYHLDFEAVDYIGDIYLNGRLVATHTGFFAPFSANVTDCIHEGRNVLIVMVKNDVTTTGVVVGAGGTQYGNKIYAATHLGYDEPNVGWHHCPAGAGIIASVKLVIANGQRIVDIWCRPNIDKGNVTIHTVLHNYSYGEPVDLDVYYTIEGRNFFGEVIKDYKGTINRVCIDENYLTETINFSDFKLWTLDEPYLYQLTVTFKDKAGNIVDEKQTHFGMRKFHQDENSTPKGKFYFNNERIILRGANEMGHLPRAVMENNDEQLIDDILIAKVANLNFYRLTQRPVFSKIYDYMDMLGMLCQADFPMFGNTRYHLVGETLKQTAEMERLTRNHPSVVIESFCNETIDTICWHAEQYRVERYDLEKLFEAMRTVCTIYNPDRVVKYCDGDYAPLENSYGMTEFHTYNLWYASHTIPYGKFNRGWLPGVRRDWMIGCGEYGVDGLDSYETMQKYYPKSWLPKTDDEAWNPDGIAKAQCYALHGSFFPEQERIKDWILESREWQRKAIKMYVHALRRRADYIQSTAVHLLIDAWPGGWTKTLVDVDRIPKPAYYAFKEANIPARISLRRDKYVVYENDKTVTELFALNDLPDNVMAEITATVYCNEEVYKTYSIETIARAVSSNYIGEIVLEFPKAGSVKVVAKMVANGAETFDEVDYEVKPRIAKATKTPTILSKNLECIKEVCDGEITDKVLFMDSDYYAEHKEEIEEKVFNGAKIYVSLLKPIKVLDEQLDFRIHILPDEVAANNLVWRDKESAYVKEFGELDFQNFYNKKADYADLTDWFKFEWKDSREILYTLTMARGEEYKLHKKHLLICANKSYGKGEIILSTITALDGCIGNNPVLDKFFVNLIEM